MASRPITRSVIYLLVAVLVCSTAAAQTYPEKPVRVIVPAPPGGALDIVARHVTKKLADAFNVQFVVDNRGGASGAIGVEVVAHAAPDGYTLLFTSSTAVSINPHFAPTSIDSFRSLSPVILIGYTPNVLIAHPSVPAKSVQELIAVAKAQPDKLTFASNGVGSLSHLTGALFMQRAGIMMRHSPYKGAAPAVVDVMSGYVSLLFAAYPSVSAQERSGRVKALAVTSAKRMEELPNVPTVAETLPGFESNQWWGLYGPAGLVGNVVTRLNAEVNKILRMPDIRSRLAADGSEPAGGTPDELGAYHKADYERWGKVIQSAGIKAE